MTHKQPYNMYIASCHEEGGIYYYQLQSDGNMTLQSFSSLKSPMYMAIDKKKLYAISRKPFDNRNESAVFIYDILNDNTLSPTGSSFSTLGEVACHISVQDEDIYCANYISGSVVKLPDKLVVHKGSSINKARQEAAHTHQVVFTPDYKYVCAVDLGMDKILIYDRNLNYISSAGVPEGHGARHLVFSPCGKYAFCVNELLSTVTVFSYTSGHLYELETYHALPKDFKGESTAAAIRISNCGRFLYVSNRGHNSITTFSVSNGKLTLIRHTDCGGVTPRDFNLTPDNQFLVCTNQDSNNVTCFSMENGIIKNLVHEETVKNPLCVIFDEVN